jgi:transcriptional regulator with XRE-family HTH domain
MKNSIAAVRRRKGLTLDAVAKAAGTTKSQIQKLEKGERRLTLAWMERLARALDISIFDLLPANETALPAAQSDREILEVIGMLQDEDRRIVLDVATRLLGKTGRIKAR